MSFDPARAVRRTGGTSKGGGAHSNIVQHGTAAQAHQNGGEVIGHDATEGSFLCREAGVYAVSATAECSDAFTLAIESGAALDNVLSDATTRAAATEPAVGGGLLSVCWVGFVPEGHFIWIHVSGTLSADVDHNQVSVAQVS